MQQEKPAANRPLPRPCAGMHYVPYEMEKTACLHVVLSDKAYAAIISEVLRNGQNETGGVFIGRIHRRIWYVVDMIDSGIDTSNMPAYFQWDTNYVNHAARRISEQYQYPLTILGFWHRHPGSMDFFSATDVHTIRAHLHEAANGVLSMLVNLDPELRMTFYWCHDSRIMPVNYDHGNEYFIPEFLNAATPEMLVQRSSTPELRVTPHRILSPGITAGPSTRSQTASRVPSAEAQSSAIIAAAASPEPKAQRERLEDAVEELKKIVTTFQKTAEELKQTASALADAAALQKAPAEAERSAESAETSTEPELPVAPAELPAETAAPDEPAERPTEKETPDKPDEPPAKAETPDELGQPRSRNESFLRRAASALTGLFHRS